MWLFSVLASTPDSLPHSTLLFQQTTCEITAGDFLSFLSFIFSSPTLGPRTFTSLQNSTTLLRARQASHREYSDKVFPDLFLGGFADTKPEPVSSRLGTEPVQVASFHESSSVHLSPTHPAPHMSQTRNHTPETSSSTDTNFGSVNESPSNNGRDTPAPRRSEVLPHVLPLSTRPATPVDRSTPPHTSRRDHRPRASSSGERVESEEHGSVPSLDLVSPGAFLFSGPSLRSEASRLQLLSLAESEDDGGLRRRLRTDSFSVVGYESGEEEGLELGDGRIGVGRSMADVLLGVDTPLEELADALLGSSRNEQRDTSPDKLSWSDNSHELTRDPARKQEVDRNGSLPYNAPSLRPPSGMLPTEILAEIYSYLHPKDFNAARRTCRTWMTASLDKSLLVTMLTRGGWPMYDGPEVSQLPTSGNETWDISRHFSRQCALASRWTGNGLDPGPVFVESEEIDFSHLDGGHALPSAGLAFTASSCGNYLLVVQGRSCLCVWYAGWRAGTGYDCGVSETSPLCECCWSRRCRCAPGREDGYAVRAWVR